MYPHDGEHFRPEWYVRNLQAVSRPEGLLQWSTTAVRNEFDIEIDKTCPVENSSIVTEKGPETNNTSGHQNEDIKDVFSSQKAPSTVGMLDGNTC
ncbi:uncharacterized protein ACHE_70319A [Aspergillus chevalieri]|uniref:Uncharacterized protein n=1 Tax=Aspergillus chevalieri TaxID=182096 RepID=A0A7R7ZS66_ASPCH|nr:uncharacterized protein ACHE_70319A [Aspergillus chevalieri]BCR91476.1 hypothetical protein ACHE_70319A [Aspergillus chevalieri]